MRTSTSTKVIGMKEVVAGSVPNYLNCKYHPKSCEELEKLHDYFAQNFKEKYADDEEKLKINLEAVEESRRVRLKAENKRVKFHAVKAERKAEREADPVKMKKYLKGMEYLRKWRENKKEEDEARDNP
jgi:phage I-like protein